MAMSTRRKEQNNSSSSSTLLSTNSINTTKTTKTPVLSDDILIKIFNTLPQKTLLKLCIVCKSWLDMIANPRRSDSVYSLRLNSNPPSLNLLSFFHTYDSKLVLEPIIFSAPDTHSNNTNTGNDPLLLQNAIISLLYNDETVKIDASSNGYILCHEHNQVNFSNSLYYYYVVNPFSQQWRLDLPVLISSWGSLDVCFVGFRCEIDFTSPLASAHFTVVLANSRIEPSSSPVIELRVLYSDRRDNVPAFQWKELIVDVQNRPGVPLGEIAFMCTKRSGAVLDDVFYWIHQDDGEFLEAVDLRRAKANKVIKVPCTDYTNHLRIKKHYMPYNSMLGVFENKLFYGYQDNIDKMVRVFAYEGELDGDRGLWVLQYTMPIEKLMSFSAIKGLIDEDTMVVLKGFHPNNPMIFFFYYRCKYIMSYDAQTQCLADHYTYFPGPNSFTTCEWSVWPHSLPLVNH